VLILPSCCSKRATRCTASSGGRRSFNTGRIDHLYHDPHEKGVKMFLHYGDMTDATNLIRMMQEIQPDEVYNLAAQSHVR
jgi:GDPmannose 4,6-dehydratase